MTKRHLRRARFYDRSFAVPLMGISGQGPFNTTTKCFVNNSAPSQLGPQVTLERTKQYYVDGTYLSMTYLYAVQSESDMCAELCERQYFLNFHNFSNFIIFYISTFTNWTCIWYIFTDNIFARFIEGITKFEFYPNSPFHKINPISVKATLLPAVSYYSIEFLAVALISTNLLYILWSHLILNSRN